MKTFYLALHEKFEKQTTKNLYLNANVPFVKYIDFYAGQDAFAERFEVSPFPAVFLKWEINYDTEPHIATITFTICYEQLRDMSNIGQSKLEGLKFFEFVNITDKILKSIQTDCTGKLHLLREDLQINESILDVYTLTYQCNYFGKQKTLDKKTIQGDYDDAVIRKGLFEKLIIT